MAIATIRSTYALRIETARQLDLLAKHWDVSKSEALRRAISEAALQVAADVHLTPVEALERLQTTDGMPAQKASEFASQVRRERSEYKRSVIAASAILAGAPLLTKNLADFEIFEPFGLQLQR